MEQFLAQLDVYLQTSLVLSFAAAFIGGLVVSYTPCIYPMIPITVGAISNANLGGSRLRGFFLSLAYVSGMAVTYAAMGLFAAATGRFFGAVNTNPITFLLVGNLILLLGLGMLDVFTLPTIAPRFTTKIKGLPGIFLIGMASGLVAGPCTAPVLGVLLAYVASTGSLTLGAALLFVFAFGMGILLIAVGTFSGLLAAMPRSGAWMVTIKKILGFFMIALAEYFFIQAGKMFI